MRYLGHPGVLHFSASISGVVCGTDSALCFSLSLISLSMASSTQGMHNDHGDKEKEVSLLHPSYWDFSCGHYQDRSSISRIQALEEEAQRLKQEMKELKNMLLCHLLSKATRGGQPSSSEAGSSFKKRRMQTPPNNAQMQSKGSYLKLSWNMTPSQIMALIEQEPYVKWPTGIDRSITDYFPIFINTY